MRFKIGSMVLGLCLASSGWAEPTISQDVLDAVASDGSARIMVRLDVPFTPEGELSEAEIAAQRSLIADTQDSFESELKSSINNSGIDDPSGIGGAISLINKAIKFETVAYVAMQVTGVSLSAMLNDDSVARISLDRPDDASLTSGLKVIGADVVHADGNTGAGQTVAVVGSGVDSLPNVLGEHEACFSTANDSLVNKVSSVCPSGELEQTGTGAGAACDVFNCDHESKVAQVLTAVAPDVSLIPVQVYSEFALACSGPMPCGRSYQSDQVRALEYLLKLKQDGVDISAVNLSLNGGVKQAGSCDDDSRKESVDNLLSVGVVTIASAGNQGFADGVQAPACISSVVAVGATDASGGIAEFSNRGGELDLLAPGVMSVGGEDLQGTSYAAPMVVGSYALVRAAKPDADIAEVMGLLRDSGQEVDGMTRIRVDKVISNTEFCESGNINVNNVVKICINGNCNSSGVKITCNSENCQWCNANNNCDNILYNNVTSISGGSISCIKGQCNYNVKIGNGGSSSGSFSCASKVAGFEKLTLTVTKPANGTITTTDNTINCGETCQADYEIG
ncbi:S8/S53 family peptidase [Candidatus Halobeggiatoa sp. HSG11]|nr:S8/S53 family peptidase [Candidatus Halobeggiatoa sp. HSG11]